MVQEEKDALLQAMATAHRRRRTRCCKRVPVPTGGEGRAAACEGHCHQVWMSRWPALAQSKVVG
eukprot:1161734-Pelagomonas_calceolata.AAC.1